MTRSKSTAATFAAALAAITLAACGGSDDGDSSASEKPATPPKTADGQAVTIGTADNGDLGNILVDSEGRTVYLFEKDTGGKSACEDACAADWPPVRATGKPKLGDGVDAAKIGTLARTDGKPQVTYNGHPLYLYAGDKAAGDTTGEEIDLYGAEWYVVSPSGDKVEGGESDDEDADTSSGGGGGGGYNYP